jgi:hypothetical protein
MDFFLKLEIFALSPVLLGKALAVVVASDMYL